MKENDRDNGAIRCFDCRSFFITHETAHPYGCRAMGFKSRELPCAAVLRSSGEPCLCREPKASNQERG